MIYFWSINKSKVKDIMNIADLIEKYTFLLNKRDLFIYLFIFAFNDKSE